MQQNSSDSYTNNRHNQVGQLYQFDADGRMTSGEYVAYEYDAAGRASTVWSSSTATLSLDGDGQQVKTVEVTYDPQTQTDVTTTKYYVRSTVLGGEVLTELESDGYYSRTFVYAGSAVLATQERWGGSEQVSWEHRDPSNASYRTSAVGNPAGAQAELDPVGANAGLTDGSSQSIPDEGSLAAYPSLNNLAQPNMTYSIDGVRVPLDHFMVIFNLNFKSNLQLAGALAKSSANDANFQKRRIGPPGDSSEESTAVSVSSSLSWLIGFEPQDTPNGRRHMTEEEYQKLRNDLNNLLQGKCKELVERTLSNIADGYGGVLSIDLLDVLDYVHDSGALYRDDSLTIGGYGGGNAFDGKPYAWGKPLYSNVTINGRWGSVLQVAVEELTHANGPAGVRSIPHEAMAQAALDAARSLNVRLDGNYGTTYSPHPVVQPPNTALGDNTNSQTFRGVLMQRCAF